MLRRGSIDYFPLLRPGDPEAEAARSLARLGTVLARLSPSVIFCGLLALGWEALARYMASPLLPHVREILRALWQIIANGSAIVQTGITLERIVLGFLVAFAASLAAGFAAARNRFFGAFIEPALLLGLTVPGLVWALLCVIWFGVSLATPVTTVALCIAPTLIVGIRQGIMSMDPGILEMARLYRFSRWVQFRYVWLPALMPFFLSGARIAISHAWKVIVLVELFGLSDGIGYQINAQFSNQDVAGMLAWTVILWITISITEYALLKPVETHFTQWRAEV